ncbi:hypothetical protein A6P39_004905 [Streptomyces sp. FXJ1.172]|uniref:hypothetical protein n=1 Tax=Streptomyces sp. FXJ1.172 TaxID=710705 RepID=UPI0007CF425F|nr:hypothetical protein [Streptomyces sp. FXJ1.172]WEO93414.1 hypothetical protein A6P39_004905 [Streptomyces sp. FXJ1.172]
MNHTRTAAGVLTGVLAAIAFLPLAGAAHAAEAPKPNPAHHTDTQAMPRDGRNAAAGRSRHLDEGTSEDTSDGEGALESLLGKLTGDEE